MDTRSRVGWQTPELPIGETVLCHSLFLRQSLWTMFWYWLQEFGSPNAWVQTDPTHATPDEVAKEIQRAQDTMIFAGCMMIGQIIELAVEIPPDWLLLCDGSEYLRADYPDLIAVLDPAYYTDATHFRVPDRTLRFGIGGIAAGVQGGEVDHTLTAAEMPAHTHTVQGATTAASVVLGELPGFEAAEFTQTTSSAGGGGAHNNMPPYEGTEYYLIARYPLTP